MQKKSLLKKSLAVLMAAAMTAGLAGCGGSGDSSSSTPSDSSSSSSTEAADDTQAADSSEAGDETAPRRMTFCEGRFHRVWFGTEYAAPAHKKQYIISGQIGKRENSSINVSMYLSQAVDDALNIMRTGGQAL